MAIARLTAKLRYLYPNQNWVEISADSYTFVTEQRVQVVSTGRTLYGIYAQWVSTGWYPNRVDHLGNFYSWCPVIPNLILNGFDGSGVAHYWAHLSICGSSNMIRTNPRISNYGSWVNVWVGFSQTETFNQVQTRCNIRAVKDGQVLLIQGVWTQGCPQVQFIPGGCPPETIDCGDCCISCDELNTKIRALI